MLAACLTLGARGVIVAANYSGRAAVIFDACCSRGTTLAASRSGGFAKALVGIHQITLAL